MPCGGRLDHRRARRRRRQEAHDVQDVQRARSGNDAAGALRVRSAAALEPDEGVSTPAFVWREARRICPPPARNRGNRGALLTMDAGVSAQTTMVTDAFVEA